MIEGEWTLGLALFAGMLLMAILDGEWARRRHRRAINRAPDLRLVLGSRPQPHGVRVVPAVYDWREHGL